MMMMESLTIVVITEYAPVKGSARLANEEQVSMPTRRSLICFLAS